MAPGTYWRTIIPVGVPYFTNMETIAHRSSKFQTNKLKSETKKSEKVAVPASTAAGEAAAAPAPAPALSLPQHQHKI